MNLKLFIGINLELRPIGDPHSKKIKQLNKICNLIHQYSVKVLETCQTLSQAST